MSIQSMVPRENLIRSCALSEVDVMHDGREFFVIDPHKSQSMIQRAELSKELRGIPTETFLKMNDVGYFTLKKHGDDYNLRFDGRLRGGGPILAALVYTGMTVGGGALVLVGGLTAPVGGVAIAAIGASAIAAAPIVATTTVVLGPV